MREWIEALVVSVWLLGVVIPVMMVVVMAVWYALFLMARIFF